MFKSHYVHASHFVHPLPISGSTFQYNLLDVWRMLTLERKFFFFSFVFFTCWVFFIFSLPMWRFLITGADLNREIKIWCTVTWSCLQTIRYCPFSDYLFNVKMLHNFVYEFYWCSFRCFILFFLPDVISPIFLTLWEH